MKPIICTCCHAYDLNVTMHCPACGREPYSGVAARLLQTPKHVSFVERRMRRGEYARNVGRELWGGLNRVLDIARDEIDDELAAYYTRCLVYLTRAYDSQTAADQYQGRRLKGQRP